MYISFSHPFNLIYLFAIPVLIFFYFFGLRNIKGKALKFANFEAIARVKGIDLYSKSIFPLIMDVLIIVLLVLAVSGLTLHKQVKTSEFSFVIAIDTSKSMEAEDLSPSRLEAAKEASKQFVDSSGKTKLAVLSFSGNSYIEEDLTDNKQALKDAINKIELSSIAGTDIHEAILISSSLLKGEESKAIILLSDGQINVGNIQDAISYAEENGILIHSLGVGTVAGGEVSFGLSRLDEDTLKSLAYNTGGEYFNVVDKSSLENSFSEILQITEKPGKISLSPYLLVILVVVFVFRQFLVSTNRIMW